MDLSLLCCLSPLEIDVESESPTYIKPENILSEQSLLRLSLKLESGIITFLTRGGEEKNSGKGKTQVVEGDTSESEEEESESEKDESKEKREEDKEEEEIFEGEPQEAESEKEEETQSEGESSSESESLDLPYKGELRRSKRKIVKPAASTLKPVIIEDISSSEHSIPDFTPTQVPFASEPSSVHDSPPKQAKPSSTPVSPPK
ncbi:X-linked retinitis pigmentosa GTPase regulator-interacting protein 1-like [Chenopodium quinoa]|uniref:X-linked retinitis pigmentosa GTPase regulator-interacting protein 1-like n=1 Tax=Chenopodium quinoa TaxID=63459 RepID=UPI000B775F98|nr:X-linked retinitis pigmentosa GTPase regulator-interacting protein 1-like [Chenopodium quinoa]XP_021747553.1 X-linked retinitis pigmentosa GTPase regulator-interacting protein 1-like [Chenopodium quinoa]